MFPQTFIYFKYILVFPIVHINLCIAYQKKKKKRKVKFRALYLKSLHHINTSLLKLCDCHDSPVSEDVGFEKTFEW